MTPWVTGLIALNVLVFFLTSGNPAITEQLWLIPALLPSRPWTAITYMFLHAGLAHIFFNMFSLYVFGPPVEARLGGTRFGALYFISGISGALLSMLTPNNPIVGASGAIFGVMLAFAWFWPKQQLMIWGIVAVEARILVVLFTIISFFETGVAAFAHLGGFIGAWLYLRFLGNRPAAARAAWQKKLSPQVESAGSPADRWKRINPETLHPVNREEYERIIAKLGTQGTGALTAGEREFMDRFSQAAE